MVKVKLALIFVGKTVHYYLSGKNNKRPLLLINGSSFDCQLSLANMCDIFGNCI